MQLVFGKRIVSTPAARCLHFKTPSKLLSGIDPQAKQAKL